MIGDVVPDEVLAITLPPGLKWVMFCSEPAVSLSTHHNIVAVVNRADFTIVSKIWNAPNIRVDTKGYAMLEICQALANYLWVTHGQH